MADTLIREAIAYGSQPLSPVPQYYDGSASYEKVQGDDGAIFVELITSSGGTARFSGANPGSVQLTATSTVAISGTSTAVISGTATVAFSATGTVEILSSAGGTAYFSATNPAHMQLTGTSTVSFSGTNTIEVVTSAGATALFSGANPGAVQLTATSTVNFSGSGTVVISGTATVNFSGSGTVVVSGTSTVTFSGSETVTITGSVTVTGSVTADIAVLPVIGTQANAWSAAATISAGATSNSIDLQYNYRIGYFGEVTNTASITLALEVSQDNTNFYQAETNTITAGTTSPFHYSTETAARYARLTTSGVSATITATIAGK